VDGGADALASSANDGAASRFAFAGRIRVGACVGRRDGVRRGGGEGDAARRRGVIVVEIERDIGRDGTDALVRRARGGTTTRLDVRGVHARGDAREA
jgi:hypothetical protein